MDNDKLVNEASAAKDTSENTTTSRSQDAKEARTSPSCLPSTNTDADANANANAVDVDLDFGKIGQTAALVMWQRAEHAAGALAAIW